MPTIRTHHTHNPPSHQHPSPIPNKKKKGTHKTTILKQQTRVPRLAHMLRRVWEIIDVPPCGDPEGARGARGEEQTELAGDAGEVEEVERAEVGCYLFGRGGGGLVRGGG